MKLLLTIPAFIRHLRQQRLKILEQQHRALVRHHAELVEEHEQFEQRYELDRRDYLRSRAQMQREISELRALAGTLQGRLDHHGQLLRANEETLVRHIVKENARAGA